MDDKKDQLELKNYMEVVVSMLVDELLKEKDMCKCEHCRLDIMAIALNKLVPKYVVSREGEVYAKADLLGRQYRTDVIIQLLNAIEIVSKKPNH